MDDYNGKEYWKEIFTELFKNNEILTDMYTRYSSLINTNIKIAKHIFMMDRLFEMISDNEKFSFPIFDYKQQLDQKIAFMWMNLQPLTDNFVKSNNIRFKEFLSVIDKTINFILLKNYDGYQNLIERLDWLREKLR